MKIGFASGDWVSPDRSHDGEPHWGGSGWARLGQYVELLPFDIVVGTLVWWKDHFVIVSEDGAQHDVDVVYMQRLMHAGIVDNIPDALAYGQKVINDVDDWYWGLATSNGAFLATHPKTRPNENTNHYKKIIARSSLVTVSTPYLLDRLSSLLPTMKSAVVTPNTVDISRFTPRQHTESTPLVGWVGSTSHRSGDLETLRGVLTPLLREGAIRLHHSGNALSAPSFADRVGVDPSLVSTLPMAPHDEYPSLMVMDIGLVPLNDTPFNRAKSNIKGLEYAAAGVPFIAKDLDAYVELSKLAGVGRLAKKPAHWAKHIKELASPEVRTEEAERNRLLVQEHFDISLGVARLTDILSNL